MSVITGLATPRPFSFYLIDRSQQTFSHDTVDHLVENLFKKKIWQLKNHIFFGKGLLGPVRKG